MKDPPQANRAFFSSEVIDGSGSVLGINWQRLCKVNRPEIHQGKGEFLWDFHGQTTHHLGSKQSDFLLEGLIFSLLPQIPQSVSASLRNESFTLHRGFEFESFHPNPSQRIVYTKELETGDRSGIVFLVGLREHKPHICRMLGQR